MVVNTNNQISDQVKRFSDNVISQRGFVLISTMMIMSLLLVIGVAMVSLSSSETRTTSLSRHQEVAEANAKIALMKAIGRLQLTAGSDRRVTARAAILEDPDGSTRLANRNWLGVWRTSYEQSGKQWPIIGKSPDMSRDDEPYPYKGIYSDLRFELADLEAGAWKTRLRESWLVSSSQLGPDVRKNLDLNDKDSVEIIGRGTLGDTSVINEENYLLERVIVPKVVIDTGDRKGAFAWFVSDNSQKASLNLEFPEEANYEKALAASALDNPAAVKLDSANPYQDYIAESSNQIEKIITSHSAPLALNDDAKRTASKKAIGAHYHHFTTEASGLFTDPVYGGYKKDLSPLLHGDPTVAEIRFENPNNELAAHSFSSRYPVIPGERKAAQGPSFAAFRDWGLLMYKDGLARKSIPAELDFEVGSTRISPSTNWALEKHGGSSDGKTFDASMWAVGAPKIHPVMTDCRWHFYFSYTGEGANKKMITHVMPRVCLWNPYSVDLETEKLVVLMANPFGSGSGEKAFHFLFNAEEANRIKEKFPDNERVQSWKSTHKIRLGGTKKGNKDRLFPSDQYLGFVVEASKIKAGQCIVYSPLITNSHMSSGSDEVGLYDKLNIANNMLSSKAEQGRNHYVHQCENHYFEIQITRQRSRAGQPLVDENNAPIMEDVWLKLAQDVVDEMDFSNVYQYEPYVVFTDNLPFVLKDGRGATGTAAEVANSESSLQLMNSGTIGPDSFLFQFYAEHWGSSGTQFGNLEHFEDSGTKSPNSLHQVGAKLLWLDESQTEGNSADKVPLRSNVWQSDSLAYNPAIIANWNVRPNLITRSPSSPVGQDDGHDTWYATGAGAWLLQFVPKSPLDFNDMPYLNDENDFIKPPLGLATQPGFADSVIMFDLPDYEIGTLSLGQLRHAKLTPYSWHPTYIVGNSLANFHAPYDTSSHPIHENEYSGSVVNTSWDAGIGGSSKGKGPFSHGARMGSKQTIYSDGMLQIGSDKSSIQVDGKTISSDDEHLIYDIAYEVNVNLWDHYFISGMPLKADGSAFNWKFDGSVKLNNLRYSTNTSATVDVLETESKLNSGLDYGFWFNGYLLKNKGAFNVNSTSEEAWTSFLSGLRGIDRNGITADESSIFARIKKPQGAAESTEVGVEVNEGWQGGRKLNDAEIRALARSMVREVKLRGPFLSMSDFINRRLTVKSDPSSLNGTIEAAIIDAGLNSQFDDTHYLATTGVQSDNNSEIYKPDVDKQPATKAWGIPGFITQGDILEPLAPALTVRGDTFVIRCYGESRDEQGNVAATHYLEAVVERTANYVAHASVSQNSLGASSEQNRPTAPALIVDRATGKLSEGKLSETNKKYGRRFKIKRVRQLSKDEI